MARLLVRCVPQLDFDSGMPRRYLFEYEAQWRGTPSEHQPRLFFTARVSLRSVVDLGDPRVIETLQLTDDDLYGSWLLKASPTHLERLGIAIADQRDIAALRFPSAATHKLGWQGWNVAIFHAALENPDQVEILGKAGDPLEVLP